MPPNKIEWTLPNVSMNCWGNENQGQIYIYVLFLIKGRGHLILLFSVLSSLEFTILDAFNECILSNLLRVKAP